jgi:hypothetical protein
LSTRSPIKRTIEGELLLADADRHAFRFQIAGIDIDPALEDEREDR